MVKRRYKKEKKNIAIFRITFKKVKDTKKDRKKENMQHKE